MSVDSYKLHYHSDLEPDKYPNRMHESDDVALLLVLYAFDCLAQRNVQYPSVVVCIGK